MSLKVILEDLSEAPEALQSYYEEKEISGKTVYVLNLEGVDSHPGVANLKNAYERVKADKQKLADDLRDVKSKAEALPEDFDTEEWERLKAEDEARRKDPDNKDVRAQIEAATTSVKSQYESRLEKMRKDYEAQISTKSNELESLTAEVEQRLVIDGLRSALGNVGVKRGLIDAAIAKFERDTEVVVEDGVRVARMKADLGGGDFSSFFQNWANSEDSRDFIAPPTGDDERGGGPGRGMDANPFSKKAWSKTEQGRLLRADRAKAERAAKAAGFKTIDDALKAALPVE